MSKSKNLSIAAAIARHCSPAKIGFACGLLLGAAPVLADPPLYTLTEIANQPGSTTSTGTGINNRGDISLQSFDSKNQSHAFLWQFSSGQAVALGTLGGTQTAALAVNDCGAVVGWSQLSGNTLTHAVLYQQGSVTDLAPQGQNSSAAAINNLGAIVGSFQVNGVSHPASFQQGTVKDLTGQAGTAVGISLSGQIAGNSAVANDGFIIENGQTTIIDDDVNHTTALGINDFGDVAIVEPNGPTVNIPFVYQDGSLGAVTEDFTSGVNLGQPVGINNSDELVGFFASGPANKVTTVATYSRGQTVYNLSTLLEPTDPLKPFVTLTKAFGINDNGWIGAIGTDSRDKSQHVFLLTRNTPAVQLQRVAGGCPAPATVR